MHSVDSVSVCILSARFIERGGPNGGNGGHGGSIILEACENVSDLSRDKFTYKAAHGVNGAGSDMDAVRPGFHMCVAQTV